jgi:hypothetical protein
VTGQAQILPGIVDLLIPALFRLLTSAGRKRLREEADRWNRLAAPMACAPAAQPEEI